MNKEKFNVKPAVMLTLISVIICSLVVVVYNLTYVDNSGVLTDEIKSSCNEIFADGDFEMSMTTNQDGDNVPMTFDNIPRVIVDKKSGNVILETIANGYAKNGIDILVGIDKATGEVAGISIVELGETKAQAKKVSEKSFLDRFTGVATNSDINSVEKASGATYSTNGIKKAVKTALKVYEENKEALVIE